MSGWARLTFQIPWESPMKNANRQWILKKRPVGDIKPHDLELVDAPLSCPRCGGLDLKLQPADDPESEAA